MSLRYIIFSIPACLTASSPPPPPHTTTPHLHNDEAVSSHPSHGATPSPSSSNEDYNTVNNAHVTQTPTSAQNTYESPANDGTTPYPDTLPPARPSAPPAALNSFNYRTTLSVRHQPLHHRKPYPVHPVCPPVQMTHHLHGILCLLNQAALAARQHIFAPVPGDGCLPGA